MPPPSRSPQKRDVTGRVTHVATDTVKPVNGNEKKKTRVRKASGTTERALADGRERPQSPPDGIGELAQRAHCFARIDPTLDLAAFFKEPLPSDLTAFCTLRRTLD